MRFDIFSPSFANALTVIGRVAFICAYVKKNGHTKRRQNERRNTTPVIKQAAAPVFGVISDTTLQRSGRDTERLVVFVTESRPGHACICVSAYRCVIHN